MTEAELYFQSICFGTVLYLRPEQLCLVNLPSQILQIFFSLSGKCLVKINRLLSELEKVFFCNFFKSLRIFYDSLKKQSNFSFSKIFKFITPSANERYSTSRL